MNNKEKLYFKKKILNDITLLLCKIRNIEEYEKLEKIRDELETINTWWHD